MTHRIPQIVLALAILTPFTSVYSQSTKTYNGFALVDKSGNISKPADYRDQYELLGTYTIIDPKGNQMHANGRDLSPRDPRSLAQSAKVMASLAMGLKVTPETLKKAIETGKKEAQGHARKVSASRALRAGRTRGTFQAPQSNEFRDFIVDYMKDQTSGKE